MLFWISVLILKSFVSGLYLPKTGICPVVPPLRTVPSPKCASSSLAPFLSWSDHFAWKQGSSFPFRQSGHSKLAPWRAVWPSGLFSLTHMYVCLSVALHMRSVWYEKFSDRRTQAPYAELTSMKPLQVLPAWLIFWKHLLLSLEFYTAYETHNNWTYTSSRET